MRHAHFLRSTPHVRLFSVEDPLHHQSIQDPVNVPDTSPPVPHPPRCLHPGKPDEVPEVEVVSLVMVPVFSLAVHPLNQGVCCGVGASIHGRAVGRASVCHTRHTSDGALAVATRHVVTVEVVVWHNELGGWKCW